MNTAPAPRPRRLAFKRLCRNGNYGGCYDALRGSGIACATQVRADGQPIGLLCQLQPGADIYEPCLALEERIGDHKAGTLAWQKVRIRNLLLGRNEELPIRFK